MNTVQSLPVYETTLLIVESPSIARIIESFNIAGLQLWSSSGYCWKPVFNHRKQRVEKRVNRDQLEDRKRLREIADWASKIVIATDNDPSGVFLAEAIRTFLKDHSLFRGFITSLDPESIKATIDCAHPIAREPFHQLERKWIARNILKSGSNDSLLWTKIALVVLFSHPPYKLRYIDEQGHPWRSFHQPVNPFDRQEVLPDHKWYPEPVQPPTTLCLLAQVRAEGERFADLQEELEYLFTRSARAGFPISYPRSATPGWHDATWNRFKELYQRENGLEHILPDPLQNRCRQDVAHEALHVIDPHKNDPALARPHLNRRQFLIYEKLHQLSRRAMECVPHIEPSPHMKPEPVITTADLCSFLSDFHVCSPSSIGSITDRLIKQNFMEIKTGSDRINPGERLMRCIHYTNTEYLARLLKQLKNDIDSSSDEYAGVEQTAQELLRSPETKPLRNL